MFAVVAQALFFFLPSYVGNAAPVILNRLSWWKGLFVPIDAGCIYKGEPLFGKTKTWRGLIGGTLAGLLVVFLQYLLFLFIPESHWLYLLPYDSPVILGLGFLLGLGEGVGDLTKSFFKRRLHIKSSDSFFPFDQLSFLGALLFGAIYYLPGIWHLIVIILFSLIVPVVSNMVAYKLGWKSVPW